MKIMDFLSPDAITVDLKATDKKSAIVELVEILKSAKKNKKTDEIIEVILEREKLGSTGIGQGVAIPGENRRFAGTGRRFGNFAQRHRI